MFKEPEN